MKICEIIAENTEIEERKHPTTLTIRNAKNILAAMGFMFTGIQKGSHEMWKDSTGTKFPVPIHGKELNFHVTQHLNHLMKDRGFVLEDFDLSQE